MNEKHFLVKFPIIETIFVIFWLLIGMSIFSKLIFNKFIFLLFEVLSKITTAILYHIYDFAFSLFVMSGRYDVIVEDIMIKVYCVYNAIIMILLVYLIRRLVKKIVLNLNKGDKIENARNIILSKETDNNN